MKLLPRTLRRLLFAVGIIVALLMLLPALEYEGLSFAGYEVLLGGEIVDVEIFDLGSVASAELPFSLYALIAFGLPLIGGAAALYSSRLSILSFAAFVVGAILLFRLPENIEIAYTIAGSENMLSVAWERLEGIYAASGASVVGALISLLLYVSA